MKKYRWKFLREGLKSNAQNFPWTIGKWEKHDGKVSLCQSGFHCSKKIYQALSHVSGEVLARVEVRGRSEIQDDKEVYSEMRIVKAYKWQKKDSVALAIYVAELVIENFEKKYPKDKRPREAIEAAKRWLKNPTEENRIAAAYARSAAYAAASAASVASATYAAYAAYAAARKKIISEISKWMDKGVVSLEEIKN